MPVPFRAIRTGCGVAAALAAPLLAQAALRASWGWPAVGGMLLAQGVAVLSLVPGRGGIGGALRRAAWLLPGAGLLALLARLGSVRDGLVAQAALQHAALYLGLLAVFARTLRPGREALVTGLARQVHGTLPPGVADYTRAVTLAWCGFFAFQLVGSALLLSLAPVRAWSVFVNVLNLPMVLAMFAAEHAVRRRRVRGLRHLSIMQTVRAFTRRGAPAAPPAAGGHASRPTAGCRGRS